MPEQPQQGQQPSPEEVAALQEKLKNMSPEELKEFQKKQCIFCQMIDGKVQVKKVYEDDKTIAVLDINPANPGHILLLPKEHYSVMPQIPEQEISHLFMVARFLSNAVLKSLEASGTNIVVANGPAAGQRAQHFMIHVIPRKDGDGIKFALPQKKHSESDLNTVGNKIAEKLAGILKIKKGDLVQKQETKQPQISMAPKPEGGVQQPGIQVPKQKLVEAVVTEEGIEEPEEEPEVNEGAEEQEEAEGRPQKLEEQLEAKPKKKLSNESEKGLEKSKTSQKPAKKKTEKKKPVKPKKKPKKKEPPKEEEPKEEPEKEDDTKVDLDDIANVLGL